MVAFFAIIATGNTVVLMNPDLPDELLWRQLNHADVNMLCVATLPENTGNFTWVTFEEMKSAEALAVDAVCQRHQDDTLIMMFTSGTTGKSKAVEYSLNNVRSYLEDLWETMELPDRLFLLVPLHHILGLVSVLSRTVNLQTTCIGRGSRYLLADIPKLEPSFVPMVPSILDSIIKMLKLAKTEQQRRNIIGSKLESISVGGAGVKPEQCRYLMDMGIQIMSAYGLTETTGTGTCCFLTEDKLGTIGRTYGRTKIKIVDGEILISGPSVMKGYYKDPEETAKIIEDGWLRTGDMGYCDEDGYYYITGRKKNVIILSNGENVNPEEIEAAFGQCDAIEECLVYSNGKGICADVYANDRDAADAFIRGYNEDMPMYRQVYKVNYTEEPLPKTGSGKIKRKENL